MSNQPTVTGDAIRGTVVMWIVMFAFALVVGSVALVGFGLISNSVAMGVESWSHVGVAKQRTQQVEIHEGAETERMGIWSYTVLELARINGRTEERTTGWGLAHRGADGLQMAISCVLAIFTILGTLYVGSLILAHRHRR